MNHATTEMVDTNDWIEPQARDQDDLIPVRNATAWNVKVNGTPFFMTNKLARKVCLLAVYGCLRQYCVYAIVKKKLYFIYSNRNIATKEALKTTEMGSNKKHKKHKSERREKYEGNYWINIGGQLFGYVADNTTQTSSFVLWFICISGGFVCDRANKWCSTILNCVLIICRSSVQFGASAKPKIDIEGRRWKLFDARAWQQWIAGVRCPTRESWIAAGLSGEA